MWTRCSPMKIPWREQLILNPDLKDMRTWPTVLEPLRPAARIGFDRNRRAVKQVLQGATLRDAAKETGLSIGRISQLLDRCLSSESDSSPALLGGLIPGKHLVTKRRSAPLPTEDKPSGGTGAFTRLLEEVPGLKAGLDKTIEHAFRETLAGQRLTPAGLHGEFKRVLEEACWPKDVYPYTTEKCAYESVRKYLHRRRLELANQKLITRQRASVIVGSEFGRRALDEVQIDEHKIDFQGGLILDLNNKFIPLRTARATLVVMIDKATDCILSYVLNPVHTASQDDLLELFERLLTPWKPWTLRHEGLSYQVEACLPNSQDNPSFLVAKQYAFDNAMSHYALTVKDLLLKKLCATTNYSHPASPLTRHLVEFTFQRLNKKLVHRLPSTTGSYPNDPAHEARKNRNKPPVITYQAFEEALEVAITAHNVTPLARLGGSTPLELLRFHQESFLSCRPLDPLDGIQHWEPLTTMHSVPVHRATDRSRYAYVNFCYTRYSGPCLSELPNNDKSILIAVNRRDIRKVRAITNDGVLLGELNAPLEWRGYRHSIRTRITIMKLVKKHALHGRDIMAGYLRQLIDNKHHPYCAQQIIRVCSEYDPERRGINLYQDEARSKSSGFKWSVSLADRRH